MASELTSPKTLRIERDFETGIISAKYGDETIEGVIGFQMASSELGSIATLVFPVGDIEITEVESYLKKVFGATMEEPTNGMPGGN
jgi:hypothetical protein